MLKNWFFWTVILEKTLESSLDCKEIKPVNPKGNQCWIFTGRWCWRWSSILWPPDVKNWLLRKDPGTGKDWRLEEKGTTEDEMVGWHHWLNGCEFEQVPGIGDGQGSLACCSAWGGKESNMTEQLNWTIKILFFLSSLFCIFTNAGLNIIYFWLLFLGLGLSYLRNVFLIISAISFSCIASCTHSLSSLFWNSTYILLNCSRLLELSAASYVISLDLSFNSLFTFQLCIIFS